MDGSISRLLLRILTPSGRLPILSARAHRLADGFRLYVFEAHGRTRRLTERTRMHTAWAQLQAALLPHLLMRYTAADFDECDPEHARLLLSREASARWLRAAERDARQVEYGLMYRPYALVLEGVLLSSGYVLPRASHYRGQRLVAGHGVGRVALRFLEGESLASSEIRHALREAAAG